MPVARFRLAGGPTARQLAGGCVSRMRRGLAARRCGRRDPYAAGLLCPAARGWQRRWPALRPWSSVAAKAVERQDRRDPATDRVLARQAVGAGRPLRGSPDLLGDCGGELLTPASPWQRLVVEQQQRPRGVALEPAGMALRLDLTDDPFVAEADAEVLEASVPASRLGQHVVELFVEHRCGMTD
jgi:hypothetical protein